MNHSKIFFTKRNGVWDIPQQENLGLVRTYVPKIQCLLRLADIDILRCTDKTKKEDSDKKHQKFWYLFIGVLSCMSGLNVPICRV